MFSFNKSGGKCGVKVGEGIFFQATRRRDIECFKGMMLSSCCG